MQRSRSHVILTSLLILLLGVPPLAGAETLVPLADNPSPSFLFIENTVMVSDTLNIYN